MRAPVFAFLILTLAAGLSGSASASDCAPAPAGLVGWWKADGNALDSVAGNNGVLQNVSFSSGVVAQAFAFDPENYPYFTYTGVKIADQPAYALTNSLSIEAWIRPRGDGYLIFFRGDHRPGMDPYFLSMQGNNILGFYITDQDGNTASVQAPLLYNQWYHVAGTLDGDTGTMSLYLNGVLVSQTNTPVRPFGPLIASESPGIGIGNVNDGGNVFPFHGDIDEVGLYSRALTPAEIQSIYYAGSAGKCPPPVCAAAPTGMIGWWKGEGNGVDSIGGNNGVLQNVGFTAGVVGQAFAFDPENYPYFTYTGVQIADTPAYELTNSLSIEAWIRPRGDGYEIFFRGDHRPGMDPYVLSMQGNNILGFYITDQDGNAASVHAPLVYGQWWHVAATLDGDTGTMSLYLNGVLASQTNTSVRPFGPLLPWESPGVGIGNVNDGGNVFPFNGDIDEVSLYNRALSAAEVQAIYNASSAGKCAPPPPSGPCAPPPDGIVGWWKGEGNGMDNISGDSAALQNVSFTGGVVGQAFAFDPENFPYFTYTGVQVADKPDYALTNSLSVEGWVRPRGDGYVIFFRGDHRPGLDPYCLSMEGNNVLNFGVSDENGNYASVQTPLVYNQWWHVAATLDGASGALSIYTNGILAVQTNTTVRPFGPLIASESPGVGIGNVNDGGNVFPFVGDIDEIALYNRALTPGEIQSIYNAGTAGKCLPTTPPTISLQPTNVTVSPGGTAVFYVGAQGAPPLSYQWFFGTSPLLGETSSSLVLSLVQPWQEGEYSVVVSNAFGAIPSSNAVLTVIPPPPCVAAPQGLIGWWKGDGNAVDSVGGNNGGLQNVSFTSGVVGQAFAFDPENFPYFTYTGVQIADEPAYALTNSLSIEAWVRPRGNGYLIFFRGDHRPGMDPYFLSMQGNNILAFGICDANGNTASVQTPLVYNQWWHVAATLDGASGTMSLYLNGALTAQAITTVRPFGPLIASESPGIGIGNVNDGGNVFPFLGDIDEVGLYDRALTQAEVQSIYNAGSAGKCATTPPTTCTPAPGGMLGWWKAEGNGLDSIGGNNGVLQNVGFTGGVVGQAFAFDPENYPYFTYTGVQIADQPAYALTNSLSIEAWARPRGDGYQIFFRGDHRPGMDPYFLSMQGNNLLAFVITDENGNSALVQAPLVYNQWYHVAATLDGASGSMSLYLNGLLAAQTNTPVRPFGPLIPSESPGIGIGNVNDGGNVFPFHGDIDEVSLYGRALTPDEIHSIYVSGSAGKCTSLVVGTDFLNTDANTPVSCLASNLLLNDSSPGALPLRVTGVGAVSAQGGSVAFDGTQVTYTPPAGFSGSDTFAYTIADSSGASGAGTVIVSVGPVMLRSLNVVASPQMTGKKLTIKFTGIPGLTYSIESAPTPAGPWTKAANFTAPTADGGQGSGVYLFNQSMGTNTTQFFRTVYPAY